MTARQKAEIAQDKATKIYNVLCSHYNANEIVVPLALYNMILNNVQDAVQETSDAYHREFLNQE